VLHLAAQTSVVKSVKNPEQDFRTNVDPVSYLLKYVQKKKVRCLVYANTAGALYGEALYFPTDERAVVQPTAPYGATKAFFEIYLRAWALSLKQAAELGNDPKQENYFSWASLRLSNVFGPRQSPKGEAGVLPIFIDHLLRGQEPTIFGDGSKTRDYVYGPDVAQCFVRTLAELDKMPIDDAFNVSSGKETSDMQVFQAVLEAVRTKGAVKVSQPKFSPIRPGELKKSLIDNNKIGAYLSWRPQMDFAAGVQATVAAFDPADFA
jgi:UDP-glucose 4-epimerase